MRTTLTPTTAMLLLLTAVLLTSQTQARVRGREMKATRKRVEILTAGYTTRAAIITTTRKLLKSLRKRGGCGSTAVCLALEGGRSLKTRKYMLGRTFATAVAALVAVGGDSTLAAVQFAQTTSPIQARTTDREMLLSKLGAKRQARTSKSNLSAALAYCWFQIRRVRADKTVVFIATGKANVGFSPKVILRQIGSQGSVLPVRISGGPRAYGKSLGVRSAVDLESETAFATSLEQVVSAICGL